MNDIQLLVQGLHNTPSILKNFVESIPEGELKKKKVKDKWTIHEHLCHLADAEQMIHDRFVIFKEEPKPSFSAYLPGTTVTASNLIDRDLDEQLQNFSTLRAKTVAQIRSFTEDTWNKKATHPEYHEYSAYILLRHVLMHDHFHMYRIEELWLTKDEFLKQRYQWNTNL